jgi:hypothetical protein
MISEDFDIAHLIISTAISALPLRSSILNDALFHNLSTKSINHEIIYDLRLPKSSRSILLM